MKKRGKLTDFPASPTLAWHSISLGIVVYWGKTRTHKEDTHESGSDQSEKRPGGN